MHNESQSPEPMLQGPSSASSSSTAGQSTQQQDRSEQGRKSNATHGPSSSDSRDGDDIRNRSDTEPAVNAECVHAANVSTAPSVIKRRIIEFCTSKDSHLGNSRYEKDGCEVIRLTLQHDMTTDAGLEYAISKIVEAKDAGIPVQLWVSMPCTAGCPYWAIIL